MDKTLYLVRHGETLFNRRGLIQGWCDSPLTARGLEQADRLGAWFRARNISFDAACCSTAERACDTLERITGQPYTRYRGLKERHFGTLEGLPADLSAGQDISDLVEPRFGGESETAFVRRVTETLQRIMAEDHRTVLVVSHGCVCRDFVRYTVENENVTVPEPLPNCCVLKLRWRGGTFTLLDCFEV